MRRPHERIGRSTSRRARPATAATVAAARRWQRIIRSYRQTSQTRGELNLPRALVTGKAFPEDEAVLTIVAEDGAVTNTFVYERRFGARSQIELIVPLAFSERSPGDWTGGIGDIGLEFKRALAHSLRRGSIVSAGAELVTPTGSTERGIGGGTAVFEPFLAVGQILPSDSFLQFQAGGELPFDRDRADEVFWRAVVGRTFTSAEFGRGWTPMVEILGARARWGRAKHRTGISSRRCKSH